MKNNPSLPPVLAEPGDDDIREYAFHLYQQGGCVPGHDLENWLEASACLKANIPADRSRSRLHNHVYGPMTSDRFRSTSNLGS